MQEFEIVIVINDDIEVQANPALIHTVFYTRINNDAFPCRDWTDFSYPLLNMWCEDLLRMPPDAKEPVRLPFMDGPFWLELEQKEKLYLVQGRTSKRSSNHPEIRCTREQLLAEIWKAYHHLVKMMQDDRFDAGLRSEVEQGFRHYERLINSATKTGDRRTVP